MKKAITGLAFVLLFLLLLLPGGMMICGALGFQFELASYPAFAALTAAAALAEIGLCLKAKTVREWKAAPVLFSICLPLSVVGTVFYIWSSQSVWTIAFCLLCVCACGCLLFGFGRKPQKLGAGISSAVLLVPAAAVCFFLLIFADFGERSVIRTVGAPGGAYYAAIIDNDQGALGGATEVEVVEEWEIDLAVLRICKKPRRVWLGRWGEWKNMTLEWKDDETLLINGKAFLIE